MKFSWIFTSGLIGYFCFTSSAFALSSKDYKDIFGARDGCVIISDLSNGKVVEKFNEARCSKRFAPCSSFKIAAALMAFEKGILKDENQIVKWDGIKRERPELNQDQTPFTWMNNSAMWVTQWITPQLGAKAINSFLEQFSYGNKDFSGGLTEAWQMNSLKISAKEQLGFISKLWKDGLPVSKRTLDLTKKIIFVKKLGKNSELYGKTGTGCIDNGCMSHPGKMMGWFVGVLKTDTKAYAIVTNASDLVVQRPPAGPRVRGAAIQILDKAGLVQ